MNQDTEVLHLEEVHRSISTFHNEVFHASLTSFMDDSSSVRILQLFQDCLLESRNGHPLAAYLDLAELMLVQQERSIFAQPRIDPSHAADKLITVILVRGFVL